MLTHLFHPGIMHCIIIMSFIYYHDNSCAILTDSPFFSNERHFEIQFPKMKTITFFRRKLSKLGKKDIILHLPITFSLKQGQTRACSGHITLPLSQTSDWTECNN